jgi:hypothetical protein
VLFGGVGNVCNRLTAAAQQGAGTRVAHRKSSESDSLLASQACEFAREERS